MNKHQKGEQKRLDNKNAVLKPTGLDVSWEINKPYGNKLTDESQARYYAGCLKACGACCSISCCPLAACGCGWIREIRQGYIGMLIEFGRLVKKLGPGLHTINPCTQKILDVDMRVQSLNTAPQKLLTRDCCTVTIDVFVNYKILIPELAMFKIKNYFEFLNLSVQTVMKTIVSERSLAELLSNRAEIEKATTDIMDEKAHPFGIDVISIETQSLQLPFAIERAMAVAAESEKESEAKVIQARGNLESAKAFAKASDELDKNPMSLELKYFQTMKEVAMDTSSTLIVPHSILPKLERIMKSR
jgi:regulator of protease activity HflC (stomatin/prohibitin superfamily)